MPRAKAKVALLPPTREVSATLRELKQIHGMIVGLRQATADVPEIPGLDQPAVVLPQATDIAMAELTIPQKHEYLLVTRTMAQRMLTAMFPRVVYKFAQKIENHREPGDSKLILEYLKGMGGFEPSAPMTEGERKQKMQDNAVFEQMTLEDLKQKAMESLR